MIDEIRQAILAHLPEAEVTVNSNDGVHFSAEVKSNKLTGLSRVQQHQEVYAALTKEFGQDWSQVIHALEIKIIKGD